MDWQQKAEALNALAQINIRMRKAGDWYVQQSIEVKKQGSGMLSGQYGNGETPEAAIENHWGKLCEHLPVDSYIVIDAMCNTRRHVRWNGYMWLELPIEKPPC